MNEIKERFVDGDVHSQYAPCRYCGQLYIIHGTVEHDSRELERIGTGQCKCPDAVREQKRIERRVKAQKIIREWIPEDDEEQKFIMTLLDRILEEGSMVTNITVKYADDTQLTIKETATGNIKLTHKQGKKVENEI